MANSSPVDFFRYSIKAGDSLSLIMAKFYNLGFHSPDYAKRLAQILSLNPHIKNPNLIYSGTSLLLPSPNISSATLGAVITAQFQDQMCLPDLSYGAGLLPSVSKDDEANLWLLSWLAENSDALTIPGGILLGAQSNLLSPGNVNLIREIQTLYFDYQSGALTKGQYDYRRKQKLDLLKKNIGSLDKVLFGNKTPHQAVRIARGGGIPATQHIMQNADKLTKLASYGKYGGYILAGVGLAAGCVRIANEDSQQKKNEIFVETIANTTVGVVGGWAVGVFLVSNPVGWGTALVLAVGTAAVSYGLGKGVQNAYTTFGNKVDLVSGMGVNSICQ